VTDRRVAFDLDREDLRTLLLYGRAMLSGQVLEFSVFQLAQLDQRSPTDFERSMSQIEGLLKQPRRDQAKKLN